MYVSFSVKSALSPSIIRPARAIIQQYGRTDNASLQVVHALSVLGVATEGDLKYIEDGSLNQLLTTLREPLSQGKRRKEGQGMILCGVMGALCVRMCM